MQNNLVLYREGGGGGGGIGFGLGFTIGIGLIEISFESLDELELLLKRFLCRSGGLDGGRACSGSGNAPGTLKGASGCRGSSGDGSGGSMRSYCMFNEAMEAARAMRVV
jgi:hypothetical protein